MNELEQINQKINEMMEQGDFGTPASPELISQAWKNLTSELVSRLNEGKPVYNSISGLWAQEGAEARTVRRRAALARPVLHAECWA